MCNNIVFILLFCHLCSAVAAMHSEWRGTHPKYLDKQIKKEKKKKKNEIGKCESSYRKRGDIPLYFNFPFDFLNYLHVDFSHLPKRGNGNYMVIKFSICMLTPPTPHHHHLMLRAWLYTCIHVNTSYKTQ